MLIEINGETISTNNIERVTKITTHTRLIKDEIAANIGASFQVILINGKEISISKSLDFDGIKELDNFWNNENNESLVKADAIIETIQKIRSEIVGYWNEEKLEIPKIEL